MKIKEVIKQSIHQGVFSYLDYYFAEKITEMNNDSGLFLLASLVSRAYAYGHIVLPFEYLYESDLWFHEETLDQRELIIKTLLQDAKIHSQQDWKSVLAKIEHPLVITNRGIYLDKNYTYETIVVDFIRKAAKSIEFEQNEWKFLRSRLDYYFSDNNGSINWQKIAAGNTLRQQVSVISGGPGTGKTTTVFNLLLILVELYQYQQKKIPRIVLAAPTGKAAARLTESINAQKIKILDKADQVNCEKIPNESVTIHRLLGISPIEKVPRFNQLHPLSIDILVVDEASMIDLQLFVQLIEALPTGARLILLGDKDQLSSVEAGSVMHELCQLENYSPENKMSLSELTGFLLQESSNPPYFDYLTVLKKSYRFSESSSLGSLASIINSNDEVDKFDKVIYIFESSKDGTINLVNLPIQEDELRAYVISEFQDYINILSNKSATPEQVFKIFNQTRVLSIQKSGQYGTTALNQFIANTLFPESEDTYFYHGLSIMIEQNDYEYGLFNGDIGLILKEDNYLRAYFEVENEIKSFSIHSLPKYETAFAMTVHKSQGSEFNNVLLFLTEFSSAFLTKELFYTGITRAKGKVTLFSSKEGVKVALKQRMNRFSFIHERLKDNS